MRNLLLLIALLIAFSCGNSGGDYNPIGLRKLSGEEMLERVRNKRFRQQPVGVVFKDVNGDIITPERLKGFNETDYFGDQYVDANGILREVVIRKATGSDRDLMANIKQATQQALEELAQEGNDGLPQIPAREGAPVVRMPEGN